MHTATYLLRILATCTVALCVPTPVTSEYSLTGRGTKYPFKQIVAFGDELSDNGSGSSAHGVAGDPETIYGFGSWTNGPVAISYLAQMMGLPLTDYAFGGTNGGSTIGATIDQAYTPTAVQSVVQQIGNYSSSGSKGVKTSMQFIWVNNDLSAHTDAYYGGDPKNTDFATQISTRIAAQVQALITKGAPYVMVANIYPKHLAPVTKTFLPGCTDAVVATWGTVIQQANTAIEKALKPFGSQAIYYDSFDYIVGLLNNATALGFTQPLDQMCDGNPATDLWNLCQVQHKADEVFWMSYTNPTTKVHQMIAQDMKNVIDKHLGV